MVEVFQDKVAAWDWINKSAGQVMNVDPDWSGYQASLKIANTQKNKANIPYMENSHEFILNMCKDLRKWSHKNYHLFVKGNKIEDELSIGCRESVNTMHYNSHFNFETQI